MRRFLLLIALFTLALGGLGWASAAAGRMPAAGCPGPCGQTCQGEGMRRSRADIQAPPCHHAPGADDCVVRTGAPGAAMPSVGARLEPTRTGVASGTGPCPALLTQAQGLPAITAVASRRTAALPAPAAPPMSPLERNCVLRI
jgi:hypothetical protein